jgi:hypothetical protein
MNACTASRSIRAGVARPSMYPDPPIISTLVMPEWAAWCASPRAISASGDEPKSSALAWMSMSRSITCLPTAMPSFALGPSPSSSSPASSP